MRGKKRAVELDHLGDEDRLVLDMLREHGKAWIVGGWVRDLLSGSIPSDIDIATNLRPDEVKSIFPRSIMVGEKYGTVIVRIDGSENDEYQCEVTTLRTDGGYADGRRPENVVFGDEIEDDVERRDFTINAMAIEPKETLVGGKELVGELLDFHGGESDLRSGILKAVGDAEKRLGEDGLRVIRAFRFLEKGDEGLRKLDLSLSGAISSNLGMLEKVSKERIWSELRTILSGQNSKEIVRMMYEHGLLDVILPGITLNQEVRHCRDPLVNLALMCSSNKSTGPELSGKLIESLRLSKNEGAILSTLHGHRDLELDDSLGSVRRFRATIPSPERRRILDYLGGLGVETHEFESSFNKSGELKSGDSPLIDGNLLSNLTGLEPGRKLGRLKSWLHRIQVEEDIDRRDVVILLLDEIGWEESDYQDWPILSWP